MKSPVSLYQYTHMVPMNQFQFSSRMLALKGMLTPLPYNDPLTGDVMFAMYIPITSMTVVFVTEGSFVDGFVAFMYIV